MLYMSSKQDNTAVLVYYTKKKARILYPWYVPIEEQVNILVPRDLPITKLVDILAILY